MINAPVPPLHMCAQALTECASFILFFSFRVSFSVVRTSKYGSESPPLSIVLFHFCYFLFFCKKPQSQTLFPDLSICYQESRTEFYFRLLYSDRKVTRLASQSFLCRTVFPNSGR